MGEAGRKRKWGGKGGKGKAGKGKGKDGKGKGKRKGKAGDKGAPCKRPRGPVPTRSLLITSHTPSQCSKATREAIRLLEAASESLRQVPEAKEDTPAARSAGESLEAELQALRGDGSVKPQKKPLHFYCEVSRGVALLSYPGEEDLNAPSPSVLVQRVFAQQRDGGHDAQAARFVCRMAPLDYVCAPHLKNFQAAAAAVLPGAFAKARDGAGWYFAFHSRAMGTIKRDEAMSVLKQVLGPLPVELSVSDAEYMVVIEVNPVLCGFSVLQDYENLLHECNLQKACEVYENKACDCDFESEDEPEDEDEDDADGEDDEDEDEKDGTRTEVVDTAEAQVQEAGSAPES